MKKTTIVSIILVIVACAIAFFAANGVSDADKAWKEAKYTENTEFGTGNKTIDVKVIVGKNNATFTIHTDKETVGEALLEHKLIDGEEGPYGLYVKLVNGIKADYDEDQAYWALSKDSKPLETGVDMTKIENGAKYELTYTK